MFPLPFPFSFSFHTLFFHKLTKPPASDHANEYCALSRHKKDETPALWMCYGGGAGFGGYGGYGGYHRRIRLFEIDMNAARITTYKRLEYGDLDKRVDEQIIVDGGKAIAPTV
jgi:hypothetical protein